jgi:Holliday junction resolvasome RuvABC endonuclease subunit
VPLFSTDSQKIKLVGMDPSLRNWGLAVAEYDLTSQKLEVQSVHVIQPVLSTNKQVRQNSLDLDSANQLYQGATIYLSQAHAVFVEIPIGSQSARAMASYGICVGVLGSMRANNIPFFELTPTEIKLAGPGKKTATKQEMINWAKTKHPEANWPTYKRNGIQKVSEAKAEHMADAVAAIHAGISCKEFQQLLSMLTAKVTPCKST